MLCADLPFERQNGIRADRSILTTSHDYMFSQSVIVSVLDLYYFPDHTFMNNNVWCAVDKVTHGSGVYHPYLQLYL